MCNITDHGICQVSPFKSTTSNFLIRLYDVFVKLFDRASKLGCHLGPTWNFQDDIFAQEGKGASFLCPRFRGTRLSKVL